MGKIIKKIGLGALLAGAAAFFLGTKDGQKMTKQAMGWMEDLVDDLKEKSADAKDWSQEKYEELSEKVVKEWEAKKKLTAAEAKEAKAKLKDMWEDVKEKSEDTWEKAKEKARKEIKKV